MITFEELPVLNQFSLETVIFFADLGETLVSPNHKSAFTVLYIKK
jgi:hypothetical protein